MERREEPGISRGSRLSLHPKIIKSLRLRGSNARASQPGGYVALMSLVTDCLVLFNPPPSSLQEQPGVSLLCSGELMALTDVLIKISAQLSAWPRPGGEYPCGGDAADPRPISLTSSIPPRSNGGTLEGTSPFWPRWPRAYALMREI